ncbi:twitching motility protein PilT [Erythrobacter sp. QSSC1-22B]|uniref:type II toxin-antitoxin system VapC family toxin n=1 Tax=Erythrobacter sp. QSSC1-22B TaxID=1860125 RepID=UPI000804AF79|nr:type II toxin-antitoxin system VapC family toxin [Erythrobacter sp. QSSC1-22B]OBX18430.1 twitching motility protein PilT [Erythrobacter sp. QSSC1-22B]
MYLLDTNICIEFLLSRSSDIPIRMAEEFGRLSVSTITVAELRVGSRSSADPKNDERRLDLFLAGIEVEAFDSVAASSYGQIMQHLEMKRRSFDRLIAAHALALDRTLVTNNPRDFADIPGLATENWTR